MRRPLNFWLLLVVVICGVSFWFGKGAFLPQIKNDTMAHVEAPSADLSDQNVHANVHLLVLNGTYEKGLARDFSLIVSRIGCVAQGTGNAPGKPWLETILINRRLGSARASVLADQLGGIKVIREFDGRTSEDAVLVLGNDHEQIRENLLPRNLLGGQNN
jgi:hypothetical protein